MVTYLIGAILPHYKSITWVGEGVSESSPWRLRVLCMLHYVRSVSREPHSGSVGVFVILLVSSER